MRNQPAYLIPGDTVLLIAPSRSVSESDVAAFSRWVSAQGWLLEYAPNLFEVEHQFAGSDQHRAEDLIWAITHPTAKAIFTLGADMVALGQYRRRRNCAMRWGEFRV